VARACDAVAFAVQHCPKSLAVARGDGVVQLEPWHFAEAFERGLAFEATLFDALVASPQAGAPLAVR
jgi:hypothetical protein